MSSFKVIKKGQYAYKRVGKKKTDYRVLFRRDGIALDEKLLDVRDDKDALAKARQRIAEKEREFKDKKQIEVQIETKSPLVKFETIAEQVIASKSVLSTRQTTARYLRTVILPVLNKRCPFVKDFPLTGPEDFLTWFQNERPGEKFFNPRKYFLQLLKRAKRLGLLNPEIILEVKNPDPKRDVGKVYSDDEMKRLFQHAKGDLKLQILMAYTMGMRRSEILKLRWDRLNQLHKTIALKAQDTKTRRAREFKATDTVWALLNARGEQSASQYIFPSPHDLTKPILDNKSAWQACKRKAGVKGRFHDLRHTFITNAVAKRKHQAIDVCIYAGLSLEVLRETYLHPTFKDTAYIANEQEFCDTFSDTFSQEVDNA